MTRPFLFLRAAEFSIIKKLHKARFHPKAVASETRLCGQQGNFKMFHRQRGVAAYDFEFLTLIHAFDGRDL
jgi:hypothetical protein